MKIIVNGFQREYVNFLSLFQATAIHCYIHGEILTKGERLHHFCCQNEGFLNQRTFFAVEENKIVPENITGVLFLTNAKTYFAGCNEN